MAGKSRTVLHNTTLSTPYALTIDYGTQTLYWADYSLDKLESSSADGSNRRLLTTRNIRSPYAMAYYYGKLYWTDWSLNGIYFNLLSSPSSVTTLFTGSYDTYGICIIAEETQPEGICVSSCKVLAAVFIFKLVCLFIPHQFKTLVQIAMETAVTCAC